jgi:hypothetical protein
MDLSTVSPEILQQKRQIWLTPGSRQQPIHPTHLQITNYAPAPSTGYAKSQAKFYGATPPVSGPGKNPAFNQNSAKFYGITPPQTGKPQSETNSINASRPISQNTEFQVNSQKFYLATPPEDLRYRKNAKAFFDYGNNRSTLASAGRNIMQ